MNNLKRISSIGDLRGFMRRTARTDTEAKNDEK